MNRAQVIAEHPTSELAVRVEAAQTEAGQGLCLDAIYEHQTVRLSDTATDQRWPEFCRRASELGVRSMLAIQLDVDGGNLGALNLFSTEPDGFDDEPEHIGLLFAAHAAVALAGSQQVSSLDAAIVSRRDLISQAKGILVGRYYLTPDQDFRLPARVSQHQNRKLRDVAEKLAGTGAVTGLLE